MNDSPSRTRWLGPPFRGPATRVVSLVPSLSEAIAMLGAAEHLVGRTDYCVRPDSLAGIESIGGTKNTDVDKIRRLRPDVVLANKEENVRARVEAIAQGIPVCLTDPMAPGDIPALWNELGAVTGNEEGARIFANDVLAAMRETRHEGRAGLRFIYFVWKDPWMAAGHETYISHLLCAAGWRNALAGEHHRFPALAADEFAGADVDMYSTEPYPFQLPADLHSALGGDAASLGDNSYRLASGRVAVLVDALRLSWYPSRTAAGLRYARALLDRLDRPT